jgi:hypothetical protein
MMVIFILCGVCKPVKVSISPLLAHLPVFDKIDKFKGQFSTEIIQVVLCRVLVATILDSLPILTLHYRTSRRLCAKSTENTEKNPSLCVLCVLCPLWQEKGSNAQKKTAIAKSSTI